MIDFEWYRSFLAIYRIGTVTGAAEERGLTQPAVTQHLAALEAAVGAPLFARAGRRMLPTERGKALYTQTAQAVETLELCAQAIRDGLLRAIWTPAPAVTNDLWLAYRVRDRQRPEVVEAITGLRPAHP